MQNGFYAIIPMKITEDLQEYKHCDELVIEDTQLKLF